MPVELVVSSSEMPWITDFLLAEAECWQISQFCFSMFLCGDVQDSDSVVITWQVLKGN